MQNQERIKQDCNWIVGVVSVMRAKIMNKRLQGVVGLEARLAIKIEVKAMNYNELVQASK